MAILNVTQLKPGMILAESVYNQQELLLLEKDTSLTKKRIWMLKTWGIDRVHIKGKRKAGQTDIIETERETKKAIENELKAKFADVIDDPVMRAIMKAASQQLQKSLNGDEDEKESA
jgi:hypothetical protein